MTRKFLTACLSSVAGASIACFTAWGQIPAIPPVAPEALKTAEDTAQSATETAQDAAKSATDTAQDAAKTATDTAQDSAKSATNTAQDATKSATNTAQDTAKSATSSAQDAAKSATGTAQDAARDATGAARDATRNATGTAQDAARNATGTARDATRNATGAARDATRNATGTAQDATRNATGAARDATRNATDAAQDATRNATGAARDATRNATGTAQDAARNATGAARDATRNATDAAQDATRNANQDLQNLNRNARDAVRDTHPNTREGIDSATIRSDQQLRTETSQSISASGQMRSADLGIWFDRSVRDGLVIADVATNAALSQAGFVEGDRIVSVLGQPVTTEADFIRLVSNTQIRERMPVIVMREGVQQTIYIEPTMISGYSSTAVQVDPLEHFGIVIDDRYPERLVIWRVIPRSPAFYAGLRAGDVIRTFAGQQITTSAQLVQLVQSTDPGAVMIQVDRGGRMRQLEADLQVSEQRTALRQDLDANVDVQAPAPAADNRPNLNIELNNRGQTRSDQVLPPAPDSRTIEPAPAVVPAPAPRNSGTYVPPRRGLFRRR